MLGEEEDTALVESPCPPAESSANGWKNVPVAAQMAMYLVRLRASTRTALVRTSL